MLEVRARMSRNEARRLIASVPAILSGRVADPTGIVRSLYLLVGQVALSKIKQAFVVKASGGIDDAGDKWEPLSQNTIDGRRVGKGIGFAQILRDTGVLLNSLSPGGPANFLEPIQGGVSIGTNVPYARYHHDGTDTIPRRRLWPEPDAWPAKWWSDISEEVRNGVVRIIRSMIGGTS